MKVHIPGPLLSYTQQSQMVEASGASLGGLMDDLNLRYPGMRFRVIDEQGNIRPHMRIFVNGLAVFSLNSELGETDEVVILQALSGG